MYRAISPNITKNIFSRFSSARAKNVAFVGNLYLFLSLSLSHIHLSHSSSYL